MTRRDVWVEGLPDGRITIRWRGGAWTDRDGRYTTKSPETAIAALRALLVPLPGRQQWKDISGTGRHRPGPAAPTAAEQPRSGP